MITNQYLSSIVAIFDYLQYSMISLHETNRVRQLISMLLLQSLRPIQEKCHIPLRDSVNLVGTYDPTGTLPEGKIFVCINNGTKGGDVKVGMMMVCRSPCLHPGRKPCYAINYLII